MKNSNNDKIFLLIVFILLNNILWAQEKSTLTYLDSAKVSYKKGQIEQSRAYLDSANQFKVPKSIRGDIYLYKARIASLNKNALLAEYYTKKLFALKPFTHLESDEFEEIKKTARESKISPRLGLEADFGLVSNHIEINDDVSIIYDENNQFKDSVNIIGYPFNFGLGAEYYLISHLSLKASIQYTSLEIERIISMPQIGENGVRFKIRMLQTPFYINWDIFPNYFYNNAQKFNIGVAAGIYQTQYFNSSAESLFNTSANISDASNFFVPNNIGYIGQARLSYRLLKNLNLAFNIEYWKDLKSLTYPEPLFRGSGDVLIFDYYQITDLYKSTNIKLNFSLTYYLRYKIFEKSEIDLSTSTSN